MLNKLGGNMPIIANEKQNILEAVKNLPEETSIEEAMERLFLLAKIEKGCKQADSGETYSHSEVKKRMKQWLS